MILTALLQDLNEKYDCSEPIYLSDFFQSGGERRLYNKLKQLYQVEFKNNYRILVVQDCNDIYDYENLPGRSITALQKYASQIDISNFFILLITNNSNSRFELQRAKELYSTDDLAITEYVVDDLPPTKINLVKSDTFCVLPWLHLYIGTDGNVLPCCVADHQFPVANIANDTVENILKSPKFNSIRSNMINGIRSKECSRCYQKEDSGLASARYKHNAEWPSITIDTVDKAGTLAQARPVYFDIRLNNICNLKCRMCSGYFSSAIAQEEAELFGNSSLKDLSLRSQQRKSILPELLEHIARAEKIYFAGGEPLLASEHYDILERLIKNNNVDLEIIYNTNFTTLKYQNKNVLDLWKKFSNIKVGASLDAQGTVAEYVRHGTNWSQIESNLLQVKENCPKVNLTVTSTVGLLNIQSLISLQQDWHSTGKLDISKFSLSALTSPSHLTVRVLPAHHKKRIGLLIESHIVWCKNNQARTLANQWQGLLNYMLSEDHSYFLDEFKRLTKLMDTHRKESLSLAIPELSDLL